MSITQVKSMVQFSRAGNLVWSAMTSILPVGVVSFSIDDGAFKLGDGVTPYNQLPVLFTYGELISAQGGVSGLFEEPVIAQNGKIVVVTFDVGSNTTMYAVSDTSLAQLLTDLGTIETTNSGQDTAIAELLAIALGLDAGINTGGDNNIITIQNRRYSNSGTTVAGAQAQISSAITFVPGSHMEEVEFYTGADKLTKVNKLNLTDGGTYYVDIVGFNNNTGTVVYELTTTNTNVTITNISGGLFSVRFNGLTQNGTYDEVPVVLVASVDDGTGNSTVKKAVACLVMRQRIIAAVYGGASSDQFYGVAVDSSNNIICAGNTGSEGDGNPSYYDALVVKFDSNLALIARKRYGGSSNDYFKAVAVDSSNNIICAGYTSSEGTAGDDALVVKFDSSLAIIARKRYGGSSNDQFKAVVVDSSNHIICAGYTASEGTAGDALVVKFDSSLGIVARKRYGGSGAEEFNTVTIDNADNIICAGWTISEGSGANEALVVKFDSSLAIIARKRYGGTSGDYFYAVAVDGLNNIICAGNTSSEGTAGDALVVKFDSNLDLIARKRYGGSGNDIFISVAVDSSNNIICAGYTSSEGTGGDALVVKFDSSLNIIARKRYGGTGTDYFYDVAVDNSDNIICSGWAGSEGAGGYDGFILKLPSTIPSGTFTGTVLTGLTLADSALTLADSALTLADSALTLADSALTLADSALTLADSALTLEKDTLN